MAVLMRHATKKWENNKKPKYYEGFGCDPPIMSEEEVLEALKKLPEIDTLVVSPFLRARQTADVIAQARKITKIIYDPDLREYLGNQKGKTVRVDNSTFNKCRGEKLLETWDEFSARCSRLKEKKYFFDEKTCVVGHSLTFSLLTRELVGENIELIPSEFYVIKKKKSQEYFASSLVSPDPKDLPLPDFALLKI